MAPGDRAHRRRQTPFPGVVLALAAGLGACAGAPDAAPPAARDGTELSLREDAAAILSPGEECVYGVAWGGFLPVGRVIYRTGETTGSEGRYLVYQGITEPAAFVAAFLDAGGTTEVLADPKTLLPRSAFWITANPEDPVSRAVAFDRAENRAWTAKWSQSRSDARTVTGDPLVDPLSAIWLARAAEWPEDRDLRLFVVEGDDLHLMSLRPDGNEDLKFEEKLVPCTRLAVRTWRLREDGTPEGDEPGNSLFVWIATIEGRPILRMSGKTVFGTVALRLARWTRGGNDGT